MKPKPQPIRSYFHWGRSKCNSIKTSGHEEREQKNRTQRSNLSSVRSKTTKPWPGFSLLPSCSSCLERNEIYECDLHPWCSYCRLASDDLRANPSSIPIYSPPRTRHSALLVYNCVSSLYCILYVICYLYGSYRDKTPRCPSYL